MSQRRQGTRAGFLNKGETVLRSVEPMVRGGHPLYNFKIHPGIFPTTLSLIVYCTVCYYTSVTSAPPHHAFGPAINRGLT